MAIAPNKKDAKDEAEVTRAPRKKSNKNLFVMIAIGVLALLVAGAGAYYFLVYRASNSESAESKSVVQIFVPLEVFTVNLRPESGDSQQYLQAIMSLQVPSEKDAQALKDRMPEVRNRILFILSAKSASEVSSVDGKVNLTTEIINSIKKPFMGSETEQNITGAYFTSFIVQ
jgi:flagellar FliL protein